MIHRFQQICLMITLSMGLAVPLNAQSHYFHQYTTKDGLPTNAVYGAIQDSKGYIWVFTEKGIAKFDGYEFTTFTMEDGLPNNDVWDLTEDSKGRLWVHTISSQLVYIYEDSVYRVKSDENFLFSIRSIFEEKESVFFAMERRYLFQLSKDSIIVLLLELQFPWPTCLNSYYLFGITIILAILAS